MRKSNPILILALLLLVNLLSAQTPEEEIKLPDIIILGESEQLIDTISLEDRLRPYWNLRSLQVFEYEPFLAPEQMTPYEKKLREDHGLLSLHGGNRYFLRFRAIYNTFHNPLLSFFTNLENREFVKDRIARSGDIGWLPTYRETDFSASFHYASYGEKTERITEDIDLYDLERYAFTVSLQRKDSGKLLIPIEDIYFKATYNSYEQNLKIQESPEILELIETEEKITDIDLHTRLTFPLENVDLAVPVEFVLLKRSSPGLVSGIRKDNLFILDHLGLMIVADRYAIIPTISFHSKLEINPYLRFILANDPQIDTRSRYDFLMDNPDQWIDMEKRLVKTPLNASLTYENDRFLPLSISYHGRWHKDYLYYTSSPQLYLFAQDKTDILEQQIAVQLSYRFQKFLIANSFDYFMLDKDIPFMPGWSNRTTLGWFADDWQIWSNLLYLADRKNIYYYEMKDVALLSFTGRKLLTKDLSLEVNVNNILQQSYSKYSFDGGISYGFPLVNEIPDEPLTFKAGLIWRF